MEGRRAAEGRAACSRRGREAPPALAGRGLRLTARALGGFARLRAWGWGRSARCGLRLRGAAGRWFAVDEGLRHIRKGERAWEKLWGF